MGIVFDCGGGGQSAGRQPGRCHSGTGVKDELLVTVTTQRQFARCGNGRMGEWKGEKVQGRESGRERERGKPDWLARQGGKN